MAPADYRQELVEQSLSESMSRVVRDSAVLCRLANQLHQHTDTGALIRVALDALVDGINADSVSVWLIGADGRLRLAGLRLAGWQGLRARREPLVAVLHIAYAWLDPRIRYS